MENPILGILQPASRRYVSMLSVSLRFQPIIGLKRVENFAPHEPLAAFKMPF